MPHSLKFKAQEVEVQWKVIALDKTRGQMTVRFYNAMLPEGLTAIVDVPMVGKRFETDYGRLADYLAGFCPVSEFVGARALKTAAAQLDELDDLLEADHVEPRPAEDRAPDDGTSQITLTPKVTSL